MPAAALLQGSAAVGPCPGPGSPAVTGKALPAWSADAGKMTEAMSGAGQGNGAGLQGWGVGVWPQNPDVLTDLAPWLDGLFSG